jgi:hypothetical protein
VAAIAVAAVMGLAVAASAAAASSAAASAVDPFVEDKAGVVVDWRRGTITATAGAAADPRMPSAEVARPRAERRAQAIARARLTDMLRHLPLGGGRHLDPGAITRALGHARAATLEYESNGGAIVRMELSFGDWADTPAAPRSPAQDSSSSSSSSPPEASPVALWLPEGRLAAAPVVVVGGQEIQLPSATFTTASGLPSGVRPVTVRADAQGRLLVDHGTSAGELVGRRAMIYVQKLVR